MSICNCSYMNIKISTRTIVSIPKYRNSCNCMYLCFINGLHIL